ncbi:MAG TPA: TMEM143 family protein [Candidatus Hydrogenedentes bacterium]|jgi:hypothetical protein|nr:TMEM143 family protein [Candidatus Hydrogenedentota bacterium]HOM47855.1 TMEM143 family protein [Candidatus Hydrogenedentota bacterium]HOR49788.1 TMEM143 family protein [Candidatus Hydrogenedentota bacterium]HPK23752.1 TMEM143 family protein [Candidatus Hydrogenedentota bacterium]
MLFFRQKDDPALKQAALQAEEDLFFVPYSRRDIIDMCLDQGKLAGQEKRFRQLATQLTHLIHFEFHQKIEALKSAYAPMNADFRPSPFETGEEAGHVREFYSLFQHLLEKANYKAIPEEDIQRAFSEDALFTIRLQVDFNSFSEYHFFYRGATVKEECLPVFMGLRSKSISFINYDRVVMYIRWKKTLDSTQKINPEAAGGTALLKLFQNVPRPDLEMLFPNSRVGMRIMDKLLFGIPAAVTGSIMVLTRLSTTLFVLGSLLAFWLGLSSQPVEWNKTTMAVIFAGLLTLGTYLWRQFNAFKNRKLRFLQTLIRHLYFKNLDNNIGVIHRIADDAEEEECKEALLGYYFLLTAERPLTVQETAKKIEDWFLNRWGCVVNFDIDDAVDKVLRLGIVRKENGQLAALSLEEALSLLQTQWENLTTSNGLG